MPIDGVKFAFSISSPVSWIEVPGLRDLPSPPATVRDKLDKTTHGSNGVKEYKLGLKDVPDVKAKFLVAANEVEDNWQDALTALYEAQESGDVLWFRIEIPVDEAKTLFMAWEWRGQVMQFPPLTPIGGVWEFDGTFSYYADLSRYEPGASEIT